MVSHWRLSESKSPQVSRILLSIMTDLNNTAVWMISTSPIISKFSTPYINPLVTVPNSQITIGIIVTFIFHSFFLFLLQGPGTYLSFRFLSVLLCDQPERESPQFDKFFILFIFLLALDLVDMLRLGDPFVSCIYSFDIVSPYGVVLCCYEKRFSFSHEVSL